MASSEDGYSLVMPFVVVKSNGGPYDDTSFAAGAHYAYIANALKKKPETLDATEYPDLVPQLDLLAMHEGYALSTWPWDEHPDEWVHVHFERQQEERSQ